MKHIIAIVIASLLFARSEGSQKKGWAFDLKHSTCQDFQAIHNMAWWYDWSMTPFYQLSSWNTTCHHMADITDKHVPMVWGWYYSAQHPPPLTLTTNTEAVLGFNEPNHKEQSRLTPESAAQHWRELEKYATGKPLVSPSAAPCGSNCFGNTVEWFDKFFKACNGCRVDYLATHVYSCSVSHTMSILHDLYQRYHKKIWLTEFACPHTHDAHKQLQYMKDILPRLEAADYVHRYAWFIARWPATSFITSSAMLMQQNSAHLTALGRYYNNFQSTGSPTIVG